MTVPGAPEADRWIRKSYRMKWLSKFLAARSDPGGHHGNSHRVSGRLAPAVLRAAGPKSAQCKARAGNSRRRKKTELKLFSTGVIL